MHSILLICHANQGLNARNNSAGYLSDYLFSDANVDGIVDTANMNIVDNQVATYVGTVIP